MLEIHKQYIFDESGRAIAVQIPIDEFEQIESILENARRLNQEAKTCLMRLFSVFRRYSGRAALHRRREVCSVHLAINLW